MFAKFKYLLAIGLLFLIPACATESSTQVTNIDSSDEVSVVKEVAEKVYEWDDIALEYGNTYYAADKEYRGKTISIRGKIYAIEDIYFDPSIGEIPTVTLDSSLNKLFYPKGVGKLNCGLDSIDKVGNLSKGDTVIVNGIYSVKTGDFDKYIYPCSIVD
jgi:hypothetical protein